MALGGTTAYPEEETVRGTPPERFGDIYMRCLMSLHRYAILSVHTVGASYPFCTFSFSGLDPLPTVPSTRARSCDKGQDSCGVMMAAVTV
jgi:hypothetical protein